MWHILLEARLQRYSTQEALLKCEYLCTVSYKETMWLSKDCLWLLSTASLQPPNLKMWKNIFFEYIFVFFSPKQLSFLILNLSGLSHEDKGIWIACWHHMPWFGLPLEPQWRATLYKRLLFWWTRAILVHITLIARYLKWWKLLSEGTHLGGGYYFVSPFGQSDSLRWLLIVN